MREVNACVVMLVCWCGGVSERVRFERTTLFFFFDDMETAPPFSTVTLFFPLFLLSLSPSPFLSYHHPFIMLLRSKRACQRADPTNNHHPLQCKMCCVPLPITFVCTWVLLSTCNVIPQPPYAHFSLSQKFLYLRSFSFPTN